VTRTGLGHCNIFGHRVISGLLSAAPCTRPGNLPIARLRGTKRLGMKYERDFAKALLATYKSTVLSGQWFSFRDVNGWGYCQTDLLLKLPSECIIFECKLTDCEKGRSQLTRLYRPVVERCWGLPARCVVVTRHLSGETKLELVTDQLRDALAFNREAIPTLHWRERNPL
jgi:hypothetical protein